MTPRSWHQGSERETESRPAWHLPTFTLSLDASGPAVVRSSCTRARSLPAMQRFGSNIARAAIRSLPSPDGTFPPTRPVMLGEMRPMGGAWGGRRVQRVSVRAGGRWCVRPSGWAARVTTPRMSSRPRSRDATSPGRRLAGQTIVTHTSTGPWSTRSATASGGMVARAADCAFVARCHATGRHDTRRPRRRRRASA